jgi:hypothetical protein
MVGAKASAATIRREELRDSYWRSAIPWTGKDAKGWFPAPRTLPLLLLLLRSKRLSGRQDPSRVYLALLARHVDSGIVEIVNEAELAYESGYTGQRAVRTWQERMQLLAKLGLIKIQPSGNQKYRYILLVHPSLVIEKLHKQGGVIDGNWWSAYVARRQETKESSYQKPKRKAAAAP